VLHCSLLSGPVQNEWAGSSPVQKKNLKKYFRKFVTLPRIFFTKFCLILVCIFAS
jgi:hypothetical protein